MREIRKIPALNTTRGLRGTRGLNGRRGAAGSQPVIVRREKLKIAAARQGKRDIGPRRRDSGHKTRQHLVMLELSDQAVVGRILGVIVQEAMKVRGNLKGAYRNP